MKSISYGHDANGNLTSATDALSSGGNPNFDVTIAYDALNRPSHTTQPFGVTLDFAYDAADNRTQVIDNKGGQSDYVYDDLNRLKTLTLSGSGVTGTSTAWGYNAIGDLASVTKAVGGTASGTTAYGYDALGRNDSVTQTNGSGVTVGSYTYTRDLADRLTGSTFVTGGVTSSHSFSYYDDNQLKVADGVLSKYDDGGNLKGTYNAATGAQLSSSTYGTANRLQNDGVYTYTYDDAGQMTGKSKSGESWTYGYDSNGQMVSAGNGTDAVNYTFDAFGNRLSRVQSGSKAKTERFAYDGADAFLDLDGSNAVTVRRQYGPGVDNLLSRQSGGSVEWYGTDAQGSVRQVFDNTGNQTSWADYEAHGALVGGGTLTDRYGFTGREEDGLTGQRYHRARVVDGQSWTSEDPMGFAAGDANLRRYVGNGPTNAVDSSGLWSTDGVMAQLRRKGRGDVADWLVNKTAIIILTKKFRGSVSYETTPGGALSIEANDSMSDEDLADELIRLSGSYVWNPVVYDHFMKWLRSEYERRATTLTEDFESWRARYNNNLTSAVSSAGVAAYEIIKTVYTIPSGAGAASFLIDLSEKDLSQLSLTDLTTVAGYLSLLTKGKVGDIHVRDKSGKVTKIAASEVQKIISLKVVSNKSCFVAGTHILTTDGSKAVEMLTTQDYVLTRDEHDPHGDIAVGRVERTYVRDSEVLEIVVSGHLIQVTPEHPFYTSDRGWQPAELLAVGDCIASHNEVCGVVVALARLSSRMTVYNIEVVPHHTYFVGGIEWGFSLWVHNANYTATTIAGKHVVLDAEGALVREGFNTAEEAQQFAQSLNKTGKSPLRYKLSKNDLDWRGTGKSHKDALEEAFRHTGHPKEEFTETKWAKDANGKSHPVEWRHKDGSEVNIDWPHDKNGPDAPHVGWQTGGKRSDGGAERGHIILDDVPCNRGSIK